MGIGKTFLRFSGDSPRFSVDCTKAAPPTVPIFATFPKNRPFACASLAYSFCDFSDFLEKLCFIGAHLFGKCPPLPVTKNCFPAGQKGRCRGAGRSWARPTPGGWPCPFPYGTPPFLCRRPGFLHLIFPFFLMKNTRCPKKAAGIFIQCYTKRQVTGWPASSVETEGKINEPSAKGNSVFHRARS